MKCPECGQQADGVFLCSQCDGRVNAWLTARAIMYDFGDDAGRCAMTYFSLPRPARSRVEGTTIVMWYLKDVWLGIRGQLAQLQANSVCRPHEYEQYEVTIDLARVIPRRAD